MRARFEALRGVLQRARNRTGVGESQRVTGWGLNGLHFGIARCGGGEICYYVGRDNWGPILAYRIFVSDFAKVYEKRILLRNILAKKNESINRRIPYNTELLRGSFGKLRIDDKTGNVELQQVWGATLFGST